ncbi:CDP-Glycerol:Poly(glycerophosphate) glycerophosphotransferase [Pseudomonas arsenicoxydans]|uniref:CDP-Glycerol:Poly(Glycerophosphate) glycerophosphotransferase n=2 Tax=Pseudomonas arsenicoxydans TaxID=702115 RepID=A0A1H0RYY8_9PSED|nr:CDP-Glycerol:Poly(glycerophosphate) glycerophosphotransferase [Pseudomonas arsenicoxydans]
MMLNHYENVWKALGNSEFAIVLTEQFYIDENGDEKEGTPSFFNHIRQEKYQVFDIQHLINSGIFFDYVVTNHPISGTTKSIKKTTKKDISKKLLNRILIALGRQPIWQYNVDIELLLPLQIGRKQIRYMYGADLSDAWSLMDWNEIYDIFLCHGVNDERIVKERFSGKTFIMGYPRYDDYFDSKIDLSSIKKEFDVSDQKKTLLWMPTLGGVGSSIPVYAKLIADLDGEFNVIVRPHPLSFVQEKDFIYELERNNLKIDRSSTRNMNELFSAADLIIADYGGTPFSSIFIGKNVIFLDVPGADSLPINVDSSVLELKKYLPVFTPENIQTLPKFLTSQISLDENQKLIDYLFDKYFGSTRGGGSARVAKFLKSL